MTRYQRATIRAAVEVYNDLPLCHTHMTKHIDSDNPHLADWELLLLVDANAIMEEFDIHPHIIKGTTTIEVEGIT